MSVLFKNNTANIYGSREQVRNDLAEMSKEYLDLQDIDLTKTTFLSYMINTLSVLSTNLIFYGSTIYKEFFFTEAQMPDSVINLGKWIDYSPTDAIPSTVDILFVIYLDRLEANDINIIIPKNYKVYAGDIPFTLNSGDVTNINIDTQSLQAEVEAYRNIGVTIDIINKQSMTVSDSNGNYYPVQTNTENNTVMFMLPFKQQEIIFNSFNIPTNLEFLQFYSKKLTFPTNQISEIEVFIKEDIETGDTLPSTYNEWIEHITEYVEWTKSNGGLYTLTADDQKYLWTSTYGNGELFFGNGIIGQQPERGAHIVPLLYATKGEEGIIIPNAITNWDDLYYEIINGSDTRQVKLAINASNPTSSEGGKNLPSLEEIKSEAITSLRARKRLVSDIDYDDINTIIPYLPISHTKPILKRSDLKINEIMMFNALYYQDPNGITETVPTRNIPFDWPVDSTAIYPIDSTAEYESHLYIPAGSVAYQDETNSGFETIFNMTIDPTTLSANYEYILEQLSAAANYVSSGDVNYYSSMNIINVLFTKVDKEDPQYPAIYMFCQIAQEDDDIEDYRFEIITQWDHKSYKTEDGTAEKIFEEGKLSGFGKEFTYVTQIPKEKVYFEINVYGKKYGEIAYYLVKRYSCSPVIRKDLQTLSFSYVTEAVNDNGENVYRVYDTPVILTEYLEEDYFQRARFDTYVLQKYINNINMTSNRMLTDFVNIKFCDTYGKLFNMKYNVVDRNVISRSLFIPPVGSEAETNDIYIINGGEGVDLDGNSWLNNIHKFAIYKVDHWEFIQPYIGEMVQIDNTYDPDNELEQGKKLVFTGKRWIEPIFDIPLKIKLKVVRNSTTSSSTQAIINNIKTALLNHFQSRHGLDKNLDRSEISKVARTVPGVEYVEVLKPESDIKFNYEINKLTYEELIEYTPQLVMFIESSITINVVG